MKLSVVIVNYNVEHFLEQCLLSVRRAMQGVDGEVFVVDNNSVDGSLKMIAEKFPEVKVIANKDNVGFAKANNQAIRISSGEYVLLLNPDTVVEDDTFVSTIGFMDSHPDAGGLGVKMLDGKGRFLPESKRGLPTPETAFYKMTGLTKLFPHSKRLAHYYMGNLDADEVNEVEILAGAFMLLRKTTLDKCGLLDETFFMYGEDIDLSYRITLAGYKNYYFPKTRIIHYKGESTKKTSVNYVHVFYKAMEIFARKHFGQKRAGIFSFFINFAIYFSASLTIVANFMRKAVQPILDAIVGYAGLAVVSYFWGNSVIYEGSGTYPKTLFAVVLPLYVLIWLVTSYFTGGYDKPYRAMPAIGGVAAGSVVILILYALLPEELRFSRALILFGMVWLMIEIGFFRLIFYRNNKKRFIVIGRTEEARRVEQLLRSTSINPDFIGLVAPDEAVELPENYLGNLRQVPDIISIYKITEIIFCAKDVPNRVIIDKMVEWHDSSLDYKIAPEDALSIIGSNSINTRGDLYTLDINTIGTVYNKRSKRLFDVSVALAGMAFWIFVAWFVDRPFSFLKNCVKVLIGRRSWVGYCPAPDSDLSRLPKIRKGVYNPSMLLNISNIDKKTIDDLNLIYARDYTVKKDFNIFFRAVGKMGKT